MRNFNNIAKLIKEKRNAHPKNYSQSELSKQLGYKNGQFISNVERGLCSIPLKMLQRTCRVLDIKEAEMKEALMNDLKTTISEYI